MQELSICDSDVRTSIADPLSRSQSEQRLTGVQSAPRMWLARLDCGFIIAKKTKQQLRVARTKSGLADLDVFQRQSNDLHCDGHFSLIVAIQEGFVLVKSELFSRMRKHCEDCHDCNIPIQVLSDGRIVTPTDSLPNSSNIRKRKASKSLEAAAQNAPTNTSPLTPQSVTEATRLQLPSQPPGTRQSPSEPSAQRNPERKKRVRRSPKTEAFSRFVKNAPEGNRWRERQLELGLNTVEKYEHVIQGFSRRAHAVSKREYCKELGQSGGELIVVGKSLALLTKSSLENVDLQRSFAYFHVLILLSYCELLRQKGVSDEAIDELIQTVTDIRERDRKALLDTVPWIHQLIVELVQRGWTLHRATELFFLNAISISDLVRIRSDENFTSILEHFSANKFVRCSYDDCLTPSYSIPGLIAPLFNSVNSIDQFSLIELYGALGYSLPDLPLSVEGIHKVHPAKSAPTCLGSPEFKNLTHDSFVAAANRNGADHEENENESMIVCAEQSLFSLICAIGAIPKFMLEQAVSPQQRWNEYGVEYQTYPQNAHFGAHLKVLFLDSDRLWQVLEHLISLAAIGVEKSNNMEIYICRSTPAESYWIEQALWLFCYIFPRNPTTLPGSEKEKLLAVLEDLLRRYAETGLEIPSNDEVIETLLAASKFGPLARRRLILALVDQLLEKTASTHLQAEAVYQRSVVLRLRGDITGSNKLLQEFLNRADIPTRLQSHSILGLLHLSQATNHAYNFDFLSANKEAKMWMPTESDGTEKQLDVIWSQIHSAGRILKGQGHFQTACLFFERCLQREPLRESKRYLALAHLADTYVEVDFLQRREIHSQSVGELLDRAEKLIRPEIENLRSRAPRSKGYRRLLLSLSEIEIRRSQFTAAEHLLMEVSGIYEKLIDPDIIDRLGHVRDILYGEN
ncbi:hypothetical protein GQ44DRAFT_733996 [Phaeosphaeriaceae sp. PMI808]|nr:hypothetical protein GQ44DRAFT_733996 [Phaeosphaeriaceae sp. PMI808]